MKTGQLLGRLVPYVSVLLFIAALAIMYRELRGHSLHEVLQDLERLPALQIALAIGLTAVAYFVLTGYDVLAVLYLRYRLTYPQVALGSFCGYAFSNSIGLSCVASIPVRYHIYGPYGLSVLQVTEIVLFCGVTFWLGFATISGLVFLIQAPPLPPIFHLPFDTARPVGVLCILFVGSYLLWSSSNRPPLRIRSWEFRMPPARIALAQIVVSSFDWVLAGAVMYVLLPPAPGLSFGLFLAMFLLAQAAGFISHVPGGLGVFESVMLMLLKEMLSPAAIFGSLVLFRIVYYLLPLMGAGLVMASREVFRRPARVADGESALPEMQAGFPVQESPAPTAIGTIARPTRSPPARGTIGRGQVVIPNILAITIFAGGAILLLSGALPADDERLAWLRKLLPLPILEFSHFLGSLAGVGLMFLARGIQRRLEAAYRFTVILLGLGLVVSLLKGLDYVESIALCLMLLSLLPCHRHFYRKSGSIGQRFTSGWIVAILIVVFTSIWLELFAFQHVKYSREVWWQFTFLGEAPRALRGSVGALVFVVAGMLWILLQPSRRKGGLASADDLARALPVIRSARDTAANLALQGDKSLLFNDARNAFVMYSVEGRSWASWRDPVGPPAEVAELVWQFRELCDEANGWPVFYQVSTAYLPVYIDVDLELLKLGEEARVPLDEFSLEGGGRLQKGPREAYEHCKLQDCTFEIVPPEQVAALIPELTAISESWSTERKSRENSLALGQFTPEYLGRYPAAIVRRQGRLIAFSILWLGAEHDELSADLLRCVPDAVEETMAYLLVELMLWGKAQEYRWFNLGLAPTAEFENQSLALLWDHVGGLVFRHGEHFHKFEGLRQFKQEFDPVWEPKYLASPGGLALPIILANLKAVIERGT